MQKPRTKPLDLHHQSIPTMLSIQAQSEVSVDLRPSETEPLISRILLLCIELERKDRILEQLQKQAQFKDQMRKSHIQITNRDMLARYDRLESENRFLAESNAVLKNSVAHMERVIADLQIYKERSAFNKQLEDKAFNLQLKLKKADQQRIQYNEKYEKLRRQNSMLSYSAIKTTQKNKIKDLQNQLIQQKLKLDTQKRLTAQLRYQIQKKTTQVNNLKQVQMTTRRTYEQKIQKLQIIRNAQDLRQSQCKAANQEKIVLITQQLNRLRQQIQYSKKLFKDQKQRAEQLNKQNKKLQQAIKALQSQLAKQQKKQKLTQQQWTRTQQQYLQQLKSQQQALKSLKTSHSDLQQYLQQKNSQESSKQNEIIVLNSALQTSEREIDSLKSEVRKLKRKLQGSGGQCQVCRIRSEGTLGGKGGGSGNTGKIRAMDLEDIIRETQKLNMSNKKIENLINHHEIVTQHSQHTQSSIQQTLVNINQS